VTAYSTEENASCELDSKSAGQDISHFYDIRKLITMFKTVLCHELFDSGLYRVALRCSVIVLLNLSISLSLNEHLTESPGNTIVIYLIIQIILS
jgi:hypothetical protein